MTNASDLSGKVALVTGSSRRMGRAIAMRLAEAGADIVVHGKGNIDGAQETAREIEKRGRRALICLADITKPTDVRRMADETLAKLGRLDILVNNVAIRKHTPLAELTLELWHEGLASVLDGTMLCSQAFAPELVKNNGWIVNIGGASAHFVVKNHATVMTAKMGLIGLTRALAKDLAPNVMVNCLIPGKAQAPGEVRNREGGGYPVERVLAGRIATLDEIAEGVLMLCNPRCRYINAQAIHISGGMLVGL